jgi:hypothetical protein
MKKKAKKEISKRKAVFQLELMARMIILEKSQKQYVEFP